MNCNFLTIVFLTLLISACASKPPTERDSGRSAADGTTLPNTKVVKSIDGSYDGEVIGKINPESKFAKLKIGMKLSEVHSAIGTPADMKRYESGKRWIPFYFGDDAQRIQTYYPGEGCLTYTGGGVFGGTGGQLIKIQSDTAKSCFE